MRALVAASLCLLALVALVLVASPAAADTYMHNPRGSNNRLNEQSANRQNADRLFDSQNNNRGGYNVGDRGRDAADVSQANKYGVLPPSDTFNTAAPSVTDTDVQYQMVYYEGSELSVEWTAQHGCGGNEQNDPHKLNCDIILQYMCQTTDGEQDATTKQLKSPSAGVIPGAESLRDGASTDTPGTMAKADDTAAITANLNRGHHESEAYYYECQTRSRNKGLFLADQSLNGGSAKYTRQNPNGNRRGLECPEERDYFPYWAPSPWKDIAVLTDHVQENCDEAGKYKGASQNNHRVYKCVAADPTAAGATAQIAAITKEACDVAGGSWTWFTHGLPAPECKQADWSRVNHLGNTRNGQPVMYNWTLPRISELVGSDSANPKVYLYTDAAGGQYAKCVLRMRYNISTDDYDPTNTTAKSNQNQQAGVISPVTNNPTVDIGAGFEGVKLAVNTAQFGRTFQDRSHVFYIRSRPATIPAAAKVYNLNVRGKRGNIVQTFPAVEYDFQPARLQITPSDFVHVQWTGSNTHNNGDPAGDGQAGDAGEGRGGTDRHNIAQLLNFNQNYPMPLDKFPDNMWSRSRCYKLDGTALSPGSGVTTTAGDIGANSAALDCAIYLTTSGQYQSLEDVTKAATAAPGTAAATTFDPLLDSAPASLVGGVVMKFSPSFASGQSSVSYDYMCTRNNNFSNRGQKGTIVVANPAAASP